ncbi:glycosyltransferase family 2 protein [Vibrio sp. 10N.286.51.F4]|uniref:glycosyltransferase family 2 protein n=1 Tax=Vibrio sp. 10N.286.51.F4 TaxID=3229710 RepID=UPI00354EFA6B
MNVDISVIVPVYNVEQYLKDAINSLQSQTITNIEVIFVNDGSTDNSLKVLEEAAKKDERIRIISQSNGGASKARNRGIDEARGKYISFMDSDDILPNNALELLLNKFTSTDADLVMGRVERFNSDKIWTPQPQIPIYVRERLTNINDFPVLLENAGVWNKLYKRKFLIDNKLRFLEGNKIEDILFTFNCYFLAKVIAIIPETVYQWRVVKTSVSNNKNNIRYFMDRLEIACLIDDLSIGKINNEAKKILNKRNINAIMPLLEFYSDYSSQEKKDIIEMAHIYFGKLNEEEIEQNFEIMTLLKAQLIIKEDVFNLERLIKFHNQESNKNKKIQKVERELKEVLLANTKLKAVNSYTPERKPKKRALSIVSRLKKNFQHRT